MKTPRPVRALALAAGMALALLPGWAEAQTEPHIHIPRLGGIAVDGRAGDWGERGLAVQVLVDPEGRFPDRDASFRLGWDERGLLLLLSADDDLYVEAGDEHSLWSGDSVELFLSPEKGSTDIYQLAIAPGLDPATPALRHHLHDNRRSQVLRQRNAPVQVARTRTPEGYVLEALLPLENIGVAAQSGALFAFQLALNDVDAPDRRHQFTWYPHPGAYADSRQTYLLRLAEKAGPALLGAATAQYEHFRRVRVRLVAGAEWAGKTVQVRDGERVLGSGRLRAEGGQSTALLRLPMPAPEQPYGPLWAALEDRPLAPVVLPDLEAGRRAAFQAAELRFDAFVFSGARFPDVDFAQPSLVEDLIGPYQIRTTFYDALYNPVEEALQPGRYGAIVDIEGADGQVHRRFATLFRQAEPVDWAQADPAISGTLPGGLGIDPAVLTEHSSVVGEYLKYLFAASLERSEESAIFLAGLYETRPEDGPPTWRNGPMERNRTWWYHLQRKTGDVDLYEHLVYLPPDYAQEPEKRFPLLLFLHGSGERGSDLALVKSHGPPKKVDRGEHLPFIVVSPQCPLGQGWLPARLGELLDSLAVRYRVDLERVYLTGLSMGGYGTWSLAAEYPQRFAAIAPICGGGDAADARRIAHIPAWVFHGAQDTVVPLSSSQVMVEAMREAGGQVEFTVYPEAGHDSWTLSYDNPALYEWFLSKRRP